MNTKNLWIACLSGAVLTTLVSNLPLLGFVNCLLCARFWGSAIFTVWLYRRLSGSVTTGQGARIGALTGLLAGALGFTLSFIGLSGTQGFLKRARSNSFLRMPRKAWSPSQPGAQSFSICLA